MKVVVAAIGSRGDVLPFTHLAGRFADAGHEVTLVTHATLVGAGHPGLRVADVSSDPEELLAGPAARAVRRGSPRQLSRTRQLFADFIDSARQPSLEALDRADVLVASTFAIAAVHEALDRSVPVVRAHMWPEHADLRGPMPLLPYSWWLPAPARVLARRALRRVEPYLGGVDGGWRRGRLHLVARHPVTLTTSTLGSLYAYSPELVPEEPADGTVTGWWTGRGHERPLTPRVAQALDDGGEWIYVGFGSMHQRDPGALLRRVDAVCARVGVRAVVQVPGAPAEDLPRLLAVTDEPHDELFRRVRAVVHHGGAGTTGAAVRAGAPSVVVPHFADQFYWGSRLHLLGVAPRPVPRALATTGALARAVEAALDAPVRRRARELTARVRGQDGCGVAVRQVEEWLAHAESR